MKQIITEQILIGQQITENNPIIYSTGVYLLPLKVNINNTDKFLWVASEFDDETYLVGQSGGICSPNILSDKLSEVILKE